MKIPKVYHLQFELAIIQMFYLFIVFFFGKHPRTWVYFLISLVFLAGIVFQIYSFSILQPGDKRTAVNYIAELITLGYNLVFLILIGKEIFKYHKSRKKLKVRYKWIVYAVIIAVIIVFSWLVLTQYFYLFGRHKLSTYYPLWIIISILIYYIGYRGLNEIQIYTDRVSISEKEGHKMITTPVKRNTGSGYILFETLRSTVEDEKLYLDSELNLKSLSVRFGVGANYISRIFNKHSTENFTEFVNSLRVREACRMIIDPDFQKYTIESIGLESGFRTKSNFYSAFKKIKGCSPKSYQSQNKTVS